MNLEEEDSLSLNNGNVDNYANYPWINKGGQAEQNSRRHSSKSGTFNESDKSYPSAVLGARLSCVYLRGLFLEVVISMSTAVNRMGAAKSHYDVISFFSKNDSKFSLTLIF